MSEVIEVPEDIIKALHLYNAIYVKRIEADLATVTALAERLYAHLREVDGCGCIGGDGALADFAAWKAGK